MVSGTGSLIKNQAGTLQLYGDSAANTYSGGTIVNSGTLLLGYYNGVSPYCSNPAGTGPITLNTGTTLQFERVGASNALIVNGASSLFTPNGWGVSLTGPITLNATLTANTPSSLSCSGAISGPGGIIKTSNGELTLSGVNNSTGSTKILAGTLTCSQSAALGTGALEITSGAKLALNFAGTRQIASLALGGSSQPNGRYGSTASSATNKNDTYFTGTGTVTVGPLNTAPVASAQSVSTPEDTAKAITLTATDVNGDALNYAIVAAPAHGTLIGSTPNVTYTSAANYNGADSFTFKANDGSLDSATVTVEITVLSSTFDWENGIDGNWSDGTKWTDGTSPSRNGLANYVLNFDAIGTYTATNDLNAAFLLNRINFGDGAVTLSGLSLSFTDDGGTLPQINQSSATEITVNNNVDLGANTTVDGSANGQVTINGQLTGIGTLTVSAGKLRLNGANIGTGEITVASGASLGGGGSVAGNVTYSSGAMGLFTSSSTLVIAGALSLNSNVAHLALPTALPAGTYHMATYNPTGSIGEFATAPVIDSGSLIAGGTAMISTANGAVTLTVLSAYDTWANRTFAMPFTASAFTSNPDGDAFNNLQEYAFGTDPTVSSTGPITYSDHLLTVCGPPEATNFAGGVNGVDYRAVFCRRKNPASLGLTYTAEFSAILDTWVANTVTPTVLATNSDGLIEVVSVPYPRFIRTTNGVEKPTFFRVKVETSN